MTSGANGSANGSVGYSVDANAGSARNGTLTIAGKTFTVSQADAVLNCTFSISPTRTTFTATGGPGTLNVTAPQGCAWTAVSNVSWISITGGASGNGNGAVTYSVAIYTGQAEKSERDDDDCRSDVQRQTIEVGELAADTAEHAENIFKGFLRVLRAVWLTRATRANVVSTRRLVEPRRVHNTPALPLRRNRFSSLQKITARPSCQGVVRQFRGRRWFVIQPPRFSSFNPLETVGSDGARA